MDSRDTDPGGAWMTALKVAIAEDEPMNRQRLERLLEEQGCQIVGRFGSGTALRAWLREDPEVDALFLDIRMPGPSGLDILRDLQGRLPVVLVTAHGEHALEAYDGAAVDYLLKPVSEERLGRCLQRLRSRQPPPPAARKPSRYAVKAGEGVVFMDLARTTHFEVEDEVVWAHATGRFRTLWCALAEVEAAFPGSGLIRVHRHLLVRPEAIVGVKPHWGGRLKVTLLGGTELESSRGATARIKARMGF